MELMFKASSIAERGRGLTFNDVLMVPRYSEVVSRRDPSLRTQVTRNHSLDIPVITSNMDTVTEVEMAKAMAKLGGMGILHRFMDIEEQIRQVRELKSFIKEENLSVPMAASIGVKEDGKRRADRLAEEGIEILTVDIAHGDSIMMLETLEYVKKHYPNIDVIAGNVATAEGVKRMVDRGADAVKAGIGPGSMCTTRIITGHGVPQLTAIAMCVEEASKQGVPVIADGGLKTSGDMVKALSAGSQVVMVGSLMSGTLETPGEVKGGKKEYRGMASESAQESWRGELPKGMAAEGESTYVACKGSAAHVIHELTGGIRSGMTYLGVDCVEDMTKAALFMEMSSNGMLESMPHGLAGHT